MKIIRFLYMLVFPAMCLHQAYVYKSDNPSGNLSVEFVVFGRDCNADVPAKTLAWVSALWQAAG